MIGSSVSTRKFNFYVTIRNTLISLKRNAIGFLFCLTHNTNICGKEFCTYNSKWGKRSAGLDQKERKKPVGKGKFSLTLYQ